MPKFTLEAIKALEGKQKFYDLRIKNVGQFESFSAELEAMYKSELLTLYARMDFVSNLNILPKKSLEISHQRKKPLKSTNLKQGISGFMQST